MIIIFTIDKNAYEIFTKEYVFDEINNKFYLHAYAIFISEFFMYELRKTKHMYIDCKCIKAKDFKQVLIILYYNDLINNLIININILKKLYILV